jgi:hypothetical protein
MAKSEQRRKSSQVMVRVSPDELAELQALAAAAVKTVPDYLRSCALGNEIRSDDQAHIVNELRRLGEAQHRLSAACGGVLTPAYTAVLLELLAAIKRLGR